MNEIVKLENIKWDYLIIGTGMGGGPIGLRLAEAGYKVLFVEKGCNNNSKDSLRGRFAELFSGADKNKIFSAAGRSTQKLIDHKGSKERTVIPFIGSGVGGSSALYGSTLQRFKESDFQNWPISLEEMERYYDEAEQLFNVHTQETFGHPDLELLHYYLKDKSLNPYILPKAHKNLPECGDCQSFLCEKFCKSDSSSVCLPQSVDKFGAKIITNAEVIEITTDSKIATGIKIKYEEKYYSFQSRNVILSAGALNTPALLLRSKNKFFPNGIGNDSGLVGRFLMRHYIDLYALKIDSAPENPKAKEIGIDDYYTIENKKYGTIQSFGRLPPIQTIISSLQTDFPKIKWLFPPLKYFIEKVLKNRLVICSILEDSPNFDNRVYVEEGNLHIHYKISSEDKRKIDLFRKIIKKIFNPFGVIFIKFAEKNEMLAHACGTCRMGHDQQSSVINVYNQIHKVQNIYVVDGSFFPTSGGTNPGLTIAANSLRIAHHIINTVEKKQEMKL